ncbi:MAG TPA: hypothetical protein VKA37_10530, partial [Halobacteriales archaeon]|nr:hypothetical protein [Halobacteriales archaeon]
VPVDRTPGDMILDTIVWLGLGAAAGALLLTLGVGALLFGLRSARNAYSVAFGADTSLDTDAPDGGLTRVRLSGTVVDVPGPVETDDGETVALFHLRAVRRDLRNFRRLRRVYKEQVADSTAIDEVVLGTVDGERLLITASAEGGSRWGANRERRTQSGLLLARRDYVASTTADRSTYSDRSSVPDGLRTYVSNLGVDARSDLDHVGVRGIDVVRESVRMGETLRFVGPARRRPGDSLDPGDGPVSSDGGGVDAVVELARGATVTAGSWRTLARAEARTALRQLPMGVVFLATAVVVVYFSLRNAGLV